MNRFNLPDVQFLQKEPEQIEQDILASIEKETGMTFTNADPRRKFAQSLVPYIVQERNNLDYALKQNLLAYAVGDHLDHKGEDYNTPRLEAKAAITTMEFTLEEERVSSLLIEAGTLFLVGTDTYFETEKTIVVPVGQHIAEVKALCTEVGTIGNGYLPGEITNLVRPLPWVKGVKNISISSGGVDKEANDPYAERIRIAPESFSVAGPEGAYEYWSKTASQAIVDVDVDSPIEGTIDIRVLLQNGELPSQEILDKVLEICSDKSIRPLTDQVTVGAPTQVLYDVDVQYWVLQSKASVLSTTQKNIERAYENYLIWQKEKMGRDIDLSELIARMKKAGAYRVAVNSTMYLQVDKNQVAKENLTNIAFGGLVDE
ncbi:baseplate J/gp47 family protein [Gracilibacillus oryzae]|uniref:Baseplate J/gp47 family protein n=1 Tax=Gracilibacillus oryzae TaxID=1672701 RepID=A0A7C8GRH9_9BACI|nr:baseplate J/gp47 family protein [Gracilibacillus oryzae]KAB8126898.1 baseplate J/gp47 family protein [Gracilibacillus oryzae]